MTLPGLKTIKKSVRWLRSRFVNGAIILGYHRIAETVRDPYSICVSPQHFAEQLETLSKYAHPIRLQELVKGLQNGNVPQRATVLTFDDGYSDILYTAKPLLEYYQIPVTVFVTSGYIGDEFWWDELERLIFSPAVLPGSLHLDVNGASFEWTFEGTCDNSLLKPCFNSRQNLLSLLYKLLLPLSYREQQQVMIQLRVWIGAASKSSPTNRVLNPEEIIELSKGGLVEIGAHTVTHPMLANLPAVDQKYEIWQSKESLKRILGQPVTSFSYPNGSLSEHTLAFIREAGFTCACSSQNDVAWHASKHFILPRFWIPNWNGTRFSRWLGMWL